MINIGVFCGAKIEYNSGYILCDVYNISIVFDDNFEVPCHLSDSEKSSAARKADFKGVSATFRGFLVVPPRNDIGKQLISIYYVVDIRVTIGIFRGPYGHFCQDRH